MKSRFRTGISILMILIMTTLSGCSDNDIYDKYYTGTGQMGSVPPFFLTTLRGVYDYLRQWLVLMIILSFVTGIFINRAFSKRNKQLKKLAIFGFMISIPLVLILIFFGMAFYLNQYY